MKWHWLVVATALGACGSASSDVVAVDVDGRVAVQSDDSTSTDTITSSRPTTSSTVASTITTTTVATAASNTAPNTTVVAPTVSNASSTMVVGGVATTASTRAPVVTPPPATSVTVPPTVATTPAPPPPPSDPIGLRIEPEHGDGYSRSLFRHWVDADGNGCDTRREVLIAESVTPVTVGSGCSITGGTWFSVYDNVTTTDSSSFDIDHVVALKEAWDSGAWNWTPAQRQSFANDLSQPFFLIAVSASSNRSKSDNDPAEWLPTNASYRCDYVRIWIDVKRAWDLSVDQAEHDALARILSTC